MKKTMIYFFLSALAAGMAFGASLKVVQPNGGETLTLGQSYSIKWTAVDVTQKVKLILLKGNDKVGIIAENVDPNSSPFPWTVGQYQGGQAVPGVDYKIRIKVMNGTLEDISDKKFTIQDLASSLYPPGADFQPKTPGVEARVLANIQVIEPAAGSKWAEDGTFTIRWKTFLKKIPRIELYNHNGTEQVAMINHNVFIGKYHDDGPYEYDWRIPKGTYKWPGYYTIRVSAENGRYEGFSGKFHIDMALNMVEKNYNLEAKVENRAHRHYSYKCTSVDTSGIGFPDGPGPGIMRVGWENSWRQWGAGNYCHRHLCFIYRSFITFDVGAFAQGKIIQKATLYITKESTHYGDSSGNVTNDHPGHCAAKLLQVLAPWSSPFEVPADLIGDGTAGSFDITAIVRSWALKGDNPGLMLIGRDESFKKNNEECISYYKARLQITTLENEG